ncbi:MAG: hypothetical protein IIT56_04140 [Bacteroidales bacterium]|nr:hypothetical protein [Bacteroidales bacterium]
MTPINRFWRKTRIFFLRLRYKRINPRLMVYLVMVIISSLLWFFNKTGSTVNTVADYRVEYYGLPKNHYLLPGLTTEMLHLTVSAKGSFFLTLSNQLPPLRIDLSKLDIRQFPDTDSSLKFVTNDDLRALIEAQLPSDCKCLAVKPDTIKLDFGRSAMKKVPVVLDYDITFEKQYRFKEDPVLQPDSVEISGSVNITDSIHCIKTEKVEVSGLKESFSQKVKLLVPKDIFCNLNLSQADFFVEKFTSNTVEVPVRCINVPDSVKLRIFPQNITLKYNIGWDNFNSVSKEMFVATVDYKELDVVKKPKFLTVKLLKYPEAFGVTNISFMPEGVEFLVEKKEAAEE